MKKSFKLLSIILSVAVIVTSVAVTLIYTGAQELGTCGDDVCWYFNEKEEKLVLSGTGKMTDFLTADEVPWKDKREKIKSVTISQDIVRVGAHAFDGCINLTEIFIPNNVTVIADEAFYGCKSLKKVTLGAKLNRIRNYAFYGCSAIEEIKFPDSLLHIGTSCFIGCTSLKSVTFGNALRAIGYDGFAGCVALKEISIPDTMIGISPGTFSCCTGLETLTLPRNMYLIESDAFRGCTSLSTVNYRGRENDYYNIGISMNNDPLYTATWNLRYHKHNFKPTLIEKASETQDGEVQLKCTSCTETKTETIFKASNVSLSDTELYYTGRSLKPNVLVKDENGDFIAPENYTLVWSDNDSSQKGEYKVTVEFTGYYTGEKELSYKITDMPEEPIGEVMDFIGCSAYTKATLTLTWDKVDGVKGYKIYCTQLDKSYKVKGEDVTSYKVQNLKECKNYDFTICYFVNNGNGDIYSEYSSSFRYCTRPSPVDVVSLNNSSSGSTHSFTVTHTTVKNVSGYEVKYQLVGAKNYKTYNRTNADPKTIEVAKAGTYTVWTRAYKSAKYDGVNKFKANGDWSETCSTVEVK